MQVLKINEIYFSVQGESTHAGQPCIFVRLTECHLRCTYCDTEYAFYEGDDLAMDSILEKIKSYPCKLVEITGGEPLLQSGVNILMQKLLDEGYEVLLETSGSLPISDVPKSVRKIVDFKTPSSGMMKNNDYSIVNDLQLWDELKFVIGSRADFDWSVEKVKELNLLRWTVLFSPIWKEVPPADLAAWVLETGLPIRFQVQLHKFLWPEAEKGV
ncbi:MAG: 7-carboxy-7-deazaguanine synthase QueE [Bacteroidetes bacterium]|nr:7-carboxy-7-deazaguanine synthase QueE [Bacteroidota bacterium]